jgi:hypothetical protein
MADLLKAALCDDITRYPRKGCQASRLPDELIRSGLCLHNCNRVESCAIDPKQVPGISRFTVEAWVQAVFPQLSQADLCVVCKPIGKQYMFNL